MLHVGEVKLTPVWNSFRSPHKLNMLVTRFQHSAAWWKALVFLSTFRAIKKFTRKIKAKSYQVEISLNMVFDAWGKRIGSSLISSVRYKWPLLLWQYNLSSVIKQQNFDYEVFFRKQKRKNISLRIIIYIKQIMRGYLLFWVDINSNQNERLVCML